MNQSESDQGFKHWASFRVFQIEEQPVEGLKAVSTESKGSEHRKTSFLEMEYFGWGTAGHVN